MGATDCSPNSSDLREILRQGHAVWRAWRQAHPYAVLGLGGLDLRGLDLRDFELQGADLQSACLDHVYLSRADLTGAILDGASMQGAKLVGATLKGAFLKKAVLVNSALDGADLQRAHLVDADLTGADLFNATLQDANLTGASLIRTNLTRSNLSGSIIDNARLDYAEMAQANIQRGLLRDSSLQYANLRRANLSECQMRGADLKFANLECATLRGADLRDACLTGADFAGADLRGAADFVLDANRIDGTRIEAGSRDPWSQLCRNYTASRLVFHMVLFAIFIAPYALKAFFWFVLARLETDTGALICTGGDCETYHIFQLLIGWDQGWVYLILVLLLITYNVLRILLTWRVSALRDEQSWCSETPPYRAWRHGYRVLASAHQVTRYLGFIAAIAFVLNASLWLSLPVRVPIKNLSS